MSTRSRLPFFEPIENSGVWGVKRPSLIEFLTAQHGGRVVRPRGEGDSRFAVFASAPGAAAAALAIQRTFAAENWPTPRPIKVRIGLHTGEVGFGYTLGNSLRRLLLSSLRGSAVWGFRLDGVVHEHQTVQGVVEEALARAGRASTA